MPLSRPSNRALIVALLALLLALPAASALAQSKTFVYDAIDVDIAIRDDGTLDVAETMTLRYSGGPFSFVSRSIALERLDEVRDIRLSEGTRDYAEAQGGKQPGSFAVERSSGKLKITWYYEPTTDASRTFTLRYRVLGAVRVSSEADEIWWVAIFPERSVPVQHSHVTLHLPPAARLRQQDVTLPAADAKLEVDNNVVELTRDEPLPAGQSLDVRVDFSPSLVSARPAAWQSAPAPRPAQPAAVPAQPASSSRGGSWSPGCLWMLIFLAFAAYSVIRGLVTGDWSHLSSRGRRSSSSSGWSSSDSTYSSWSSSSSSSDSSWSSSSSSSDSSWSSSSSSSDSGGSGGGGGDAG